MPDVFGFQSKAIAEILSSFARKRNANPVEDVKHQPPASGLPKPRQYWVVPKGTIPAATDDNTPGEGEAYLLRLDKEATTPVLIRHTDFGGNDVVVEVSNYRTTDLVEESELQPKLRATEDSFGDLAILAEGESAPSEEVITPVMNQAVSQTATYCRPYKRGRPLAFIDFPYQFDKDAFVLRDYSTNSNLLKSAISWGTISFTYEDQTDNPGSINPPFKSADGGLSPAIVLLLHSQHKYAMWFDHDESSSEDRNPGSQHLTSAPYGPFRIVYRENIDPSQSTSTYPRYVYAMVKYQQTDRQVCHAVCNSESATGQLNEYKANFQEPDTPSNWFDEFPELNIANIERRWSDEYWIGIKYLVDVSIWGRYRENNLDQIQFFSSGHPAVPLYERNAREVDAKIVGYRFNDSVTQYELATAESADQDCVTWRDYAFSSFHFRLVALWEPEIENLECLVTLPNSDCSMQEMDGVMTITRLGDRGVHVQGVAQGNPDNFVPPPYPDGFHPGDTDSADCVEISYPDPHGVPIGTGVEWHFEPAPVNESVSPTVIGGQSPYAFSIKTGTVPTGMALDSNTGEISGQATANGETGSVSIEVTDDNGAKGVSQVYDWEVGT